MTMTKTAMKTYWRSFICLYSSSRFLYVCLCDPIRIYRLTMLEWEREKSKKKKKNDQTPINYDDEDDYDDDHHLNVADDDDDES